MQPLILPFITGLALGLLLMFLIIRVRFVHKATWKEQENTLHNLREQLVKIESLASDRKQQIVDQKNELLLGMNELRQVEKTLAKREAEFLALKEKMETHLTHTDTLKNASIAEFKNLAQDILTKNSETFSKQNEENIDRILHPLKENIRQFKTKVEETYDKESKERFSLEKNIQQLVALNQQISREAHNLTKALKGDAKTQGNWGEMILESILEHSGLVKGREYETQHRYTDSDGNKKQPDVLISYPDNRQIVIDAKVSLTAYERFANSDDSSEQKTFLQAHVQSLKQHIDGLSSKNYDALDKTLDFVMLFVPIEPAYMAAMQYDNELWSYAYKKRILLISPTNLIAALKMVTDIWKREYQNSNALKIAEHGEKLYDKLVGFVEDMQDIDKALQKANDTYQDAMKKLHTGRGNLIRRAEQMKAMGLQPKKTIPEEFLGQNTPLNSENDQGSSGRPPEVST